MFFPICISIDVWFNHFNPHEPWKSITICMTFHHKIPRNIRKNKEEDIHIPKLSEKSITIPLYIPIYSHQPRQLKWTEHEVHIPPFSPRIKEIYRQSDGLIIVLPPWCEIVIKSLPWFGERWFSWFFLLGFEQSWIVVLESSIGQNMWYFLWDFMGILMTFGFVELGCSPPCSSPCSSLIGKQWKHLWKKIWNNICGSSSLFYTCHEFSWFWMDSFVLVLELGCSPPCSGKDGTILEKIWNKWWNMRMVLSDFLECSSSIDASMFSSIKEEQQGEASQLQNQNKQVHPKPREFPHKLPHVFSVITE